MRPFLQKRLDLSFLALELVGQHFVARSGRVLLLLEFAVLLLESLEFRL